MNTPGTPSAAKTKGVWSWGLLQLGAFIKLLLYVVVMGLCLEVMARRFRYRAFFGCFVVMAGGIVVSAAVRFGFLEKWGLVGHESLVLWGGVMLSMLLGGMAAGILGRKLGYWEIYSATLIVVGLVWVHLHRGWASVFGLGPGDSGSYFQLLGASSAPGVRYLGMLWDRIVALAGIAGFLVAVIGGSLAYIFWAKGSKVASDFEWSVSRRHLQARSEALVSLTAVVAVVGIALGVNALVAVTSVMSGYQEDIQRKILSTNAHLVVQKYGIDFVEHEAIASKGLAVDGVLAATPFGFNEAMLSVDERGMGVLIKGVVPATAGDVTGIEDNLCDARHLQEGCRRFVKSEQKQLPRLLSPEDGVPSLVVGAELFKRIGKPVGSVVTITTPVGIAGARGNAPKRMRFRIGGVFRSGMHEFDVRLAYAELGAFQRLMGLGQAVNGLEFKVREPEQVSAVAARVLSAVGRYPYHSLDWRELNASIFTALKLQKIVMFLVLCFIIIVAAFNIASTLFMTVVEKSRDIAILKSMGAHDQSIMKIFVFEGWILGSLGTLGGVVLGLLVCAALSKLNLSIAADVYMVESLKVRVQPFEVLVTILAALGISHLATLYPAIKAARQRPVDAMRYE